MAIMAVMPVYDSDAGVTVDAVELPLFDLPAGAIATGPAGEPVETISADRRRTMRQAADLAKGFHPLGVKLHPEAAPADDRRAPGRRCGNCLHYGPQGVGGTAGTYPKCFYGRGTSHNRISGSPDTDCRQWWPGCKQHEYETREESQ